MDIETQGALSELRRTLLADPEVVALPNWQRIVMVGVVQPDTACMYGYCFDETQEWEAAAPRNAAALDLLRRFHAATLTADSSGSVWVSCLFIIAPDAPTRCMFERDDAARWAIAPANHVERIEEFRSLAFAAR